MMAHYRGMNDGEWKALVGAGVKRVKFSATENKDYLDTGYSLEWTQLEKMIGDAAVKILRSLNGN